MVIFDDEIFDGESLSGFCNSVSFFKHIIIEDFPGDNKSFSNLILIFCSLEVNIELFITRTSKCNPVDSGAIQFFYFIQEIQFPHNAHTFSR